MLIVDERGVDRGRLSAPTWLDSAQELLTSLPVRTVRVLDGRVLNGTRKKRTLEQLGEELALTRERVRQIESRGIERISTLVALKQNQVLVEEAAGLGQDLGPIFSLAELREHLGLDPSTTDHELEVELLVFVADQFLREGDFFFDRDFAEGVQRLTEVLQSGETTEDNIRNVLLDVGVKSQHIDEAISRIPNIRRVNGRLVRWSGTLGDKAVVILRLYGQTMTVNELIDALGEGSRGTLVNYFANDSRVVRRGPKKWGLTEWGGERYETIAKAMTEELECAGGALPLEALVRRVRDRFEIPRNSIVIMSGTSPLFIAEGTWVRLRREDEPYIPDSAIEECSACVVIDGAWAWRCVVSHDVLRGSGLLLPEPFGAVIGLRPLARLELDSDFGPIPLTWSAQNPAIGSLRRPAEALGARDNDLLFVRADEGHLDFHLARADEIEPAGAREQLLLRLGQGADRSGWQARCAEAVGLPAHAQPSEIDSLLEVRGDRDVLRLYRTAVRAEDTT